jgi:hypothetical protein
MGDHDTLGQTRSAAGVAEEGSLLSTISSVPLQFFQTAKRFALTDEVVHRLEAIAASRLARHLEYVNAVLGDPALLGGSARGVEQCVAGEESLCARVFELVYKLLSAVSRVRR